MNTNTIGAITELKCQLHFMELGYVVSVPLTPERYDFILDTGEHLYKIQVKTSHADEGGFSFSVCSSHFVNGKVKHTHYKDDNIDFFCTEFEGNCYLVPVSECGKDSKKLRLEPTKNGQVKGISFAKDYLAKEVLSK